jgi:hypothetical protein
MDVHFHIQDLDSDVGIFFTLFHYPFHHIGFKEQQKGTLYVFSFIVGIFFTYKAVVPNFSVCHMFASTCESAPYATVSVTHITVIIY